jgi:hypothetical protein
MLRSTFNTLEYTGILDRIYSFIANFANRHILSRNTLNTELIADVFNAVDGFWLKYGKDHFYYNEDICVIVGTIAETLRDNTLTANEVRILTRFVTSRWSPDVASDKAKTPLESLLPPKVEEIVNRSLDFYRLSLLGIPRKPEEYVSTSTQIISDNIGESDEIIFENIRLSVLDTLKASYNSIVDE